MLRRRPDLVLILALVVSAVAAVALEAAGVSLGRVTRVNVALIALLLVGLVAALTLARRAADADAEDAIGLLGQPGGEDAPAPAADEPGSTHEPDAPSWEPLIAFARELTASPEIDRLHTTVARNLPRLLGCSDAWVVTRFGTRQRIIVAQDENGRTQPMLDRPRSWVTFPLTVDGTRVGVMGLGTTAAAMHDAQMRRVTEVAALLAHSLRNSEAFERMREENTIDKLTGCLTRSEGTDRLEIELSRTQRSGRPLAMLLLDLDHFKGINDRYGHPCGDAVLSRVGRIMMQSLRASDVRCRWGGEEFLIALPETSLEPAKTVAEVLRRRIAAARIDYRGEGVQTTASVGVTVTRPGEAGLRNLLVRADAALYRAKHQGRNCVRAVVGDLRGNPVALFPHPAGTATALPFPDRRDPARADRRKVPGPGRRRTDVWVAAASDHRA